MSTCSECGKEFESYKLRPYGKDFSLICFNCGMSQENRERTEANFNLQLEAAFSTKKGGQVVVIGEAAGPYPINITDLEN